MDDMEVEMEKAERPKVNAKNDRQEEMHLEDQNSCRVEKAQKSIDIAVNYEIVGGNGTEDLSGQSDILGMNTSGKSTMNDKKISGENSIKMEKNLDGPITPNADESSKDQNADKDGPITPNADESSKDQNADADPKDMKLIEEAETGTLEEQAAFMNELESFYKEKGMPFRPPKFYGKPLNCLKLYRAVIRHGGYDRVTNHKIWRQIGESFNPPKTCTTVSYAFRIFYEKALQEYEKHKLQIGEIQLAHPPVPEPPVVANVPNDQQTTGSGRQRRDAAARAMQGWHALREYGYGEIAEPIIKDKNYNNIVKREKNLKSIGSVKNKRLKDVEQEHPAKAARTETSKQLDISVVDVGPPADWVKINVKEHTDCFEVYALVPGLLREEIRVQTDPEGRVVITGRPEQRDNPWGITAFQKVICLTARIDPFRTSAVVSLHGRLFVRIPIEPSM